MDHIRSNINRLRGNRSIKQIADAAGIGQSWLQRFMNPDKADGIRKANADKLAPVARELGVSLEALLHQDLTGGVETSQAVGFDDETINQAFELVYLLADARPEDPLFRRPSWATVKAAAKAVVAAEDDQREAIRIFLSGLHETV